MSKNLDQIFTANPITTNASTDLMYFMQSPYTSGTDAGMTFANFSAQFGAPYTAAALTKTDDTNVTLTLGGTPATALLHAASLTLGWTGQLSVPRGGSGAGSFSAYSVICGGTTSTDSLQNVSGVGTSGQVLTSNGVGALPTWQAAAIGVTPSQVQHQVFTTATSSGNVGNNYSATFSPAFTSLLGGELISFQATAANTNNQTNHFATLNVDGLGAAILLINTLGTLIPAWEGALGAGESYECFYDVSHSAWIILNPSTVVTGDILVNQGWNYGVDTTGSANVYQITIPTLILDASGNIQDGAKISFKSPNANTGASTLAVNGSSANIILESGAALSGGEILANGTYECTFNTSLNGWILLNPTSGGGGVFIAGGTNSAQAPNSTAAGNNSLSLGAGAVASGNNCLAIGTSASATQDSCVALGSGAVAHGAGGSFAVGQSASATGQESIAIGFSSGANSPSGIAIGPNSSSSNNDAICIGDTSVAGGFASIAIGRNSTASGDFSVALGAFSGTNNSGSFVFVDSSGSPKTDTASNQFVSTFSGGFFFYHNSSTQHAAIDANGNLINNKGTSDQSYSYQTPSTGFNITIGADVKTLILDPAGTLVAGTVTMPAAPIDGQEIRVCSSQIITGLTVSANAGQSIVGAPTTLGVGGGFGYIYRLANTTWYRLY